MIIIKFSILALMCLSLSSCTEHQRANSDSVNILFLHHSTGSVIWKGQSSLLNKKTSLPYMFEKYNKENHKAFIIREREFPKDSPYGWKNYPFDYYNIWVKNAGPTPYLEEPTLEMLTKDYDVIIFKHCFPVSNIQESSGTSNIDSEVKTIENYKLQYAALRSKLHQFPSTKFIVFTGAAQVASNITESEALKAQEFFRWVINEWDSKDDNIFIWDLYNLETNGTLYLLNEYAISPSDSHPNRKFAATAAELLFSRIIDVIKNEGQSTTLMGERI